MKTKSFEINILADNFKSVKSSLFFGDIFQRFLNLCKVEFHESPVIGLDADYYTISFEDSKQVRKEVLALNRHALSDMYYVQKEDGLSVALDVELLVNSLLKLFVL